MAVDWATIGNNVIAAVKGVIAANWQSVAQGATAAIQSLVNIAQYIEQNGDQMSAEEKTQLMDEYQRALQNTLSSYAAITAAVAQNAVAAGVNALINMVPSLAGFAL